MFACDRLNSRSAVRFFDNDVSHRFEKHAQHFARVFLILDNQDAAFVRSLLRLVQSVNDSMRLPGKPYGEFAAPADAIAMSLDFAAVELDDLAHQSQSDSEAAGRSLETLLVLNE